MNKTDGVTKELQPNKCDKYEPKELFDGWTQYCDTEIQSYYYFNEKTGEATWIPPTQTEEEMSFSSKYEKENQQGAGKRKRRNTKKRKGKGKRQNTKKRGSSKR